MEDSVSILKKYWGHAQFRAVQPEIINSSLAGQDTLALLPTGGGKSICFQVPGLQLDGLCIVVSPLIALMKDQVENLKSKGIYAVAVHSAMSREEIDIHRRPDLDDNAFGGAQHGLCLVVARRLSQCAARHAGVSVRSLEWARTRAA